MGGPLCISQWPGTTRLEKKVQTAVEYRAAERNILSWGFQCPSPGDSKPEKRVVDRFKLFLDYDFLKDAPDEVGTHEDVQIWFEDFLRALHKHVVIEVCNKLKLDKNSWESQTVHYLFSVPTTWNAEVAEMLEKVVRRAGFRAEAPHSVEIRLSEAEAAAVYTACSSRHQRPVNYSEHDTDSQDPVDGPRFCKDNILLVCDSGGGTTVFLPPLNRFLRSSIAKIIYRIPPSFKLKP
jgi:hypothetical protein